MQRAVVAYEIDASALIDIWHPQHDELQRIRAAVEFRDRSQIVRQVGRSLAKSACTIGEYETRAASLCNSRDYRAASDALERALARARELGWRSPEVRQRLEELGNAFDASVVTAIIDDVAK